MDAETEKAIQYSQKLLNAAIDVVGAARVTLNENWARDPKIVGLTILCRSISNFRAAVRLLQQEQVQEARVLVRLLYENMLWMAALRERGSDFVKDMIDDEGFNRRALAELTMKLTHKHGGDVDAPESLKLRSIIRDLDKKFPSMKKLQASKTAAEGVVEIAYIEYVRFSLDGVHCSVMALGKHLARESAKGNVEITVSVIPRTSDEETKSTILHACCALTGAAVGANELVGFTAASTMLGTLVTEYESNGWQRS
jgi:hypothetical protein